MGAGGLLALGHTIALYEIGLAVKGLGMAVVPSIRVPGAVGMVEQRSSLYGLLVKRKDKVGWEAVPAAQFDSRVVKRPGR